MNPTIAAKLAKMQSRIATDGMAAFDKYSNRAADLKGRVTSAAEALQTAIGAEGTAKFQRRVFGVISRLDRVLTADMSPLGLVASGDQDKAYLTFAKNLTQLCALQQISYLTEYKSTAYSRPELVLYLLGLQAIGWEAEAKSYGEYIFTERAADLNQNGIMPNELLAWFSVYFTLGSRDLIAPTGIKEPNKPDSVYSMLLGKWKNPDPAEVSNTLLAYAERNVAETLLPQSKRPLDLQLPDLLFIPYDVLAINMRRHAEGLAWVDIDDPRMEGWPVSTEKMPLVKDNVTWPIYVELCKLVGVEPMRTEKEIEVTVDPETLEIVSY